jgi:hypothetical protein
MPAQQPPINGVELQNAGIGVHMTATQGRGVNISFSTKATGGGDLAPFAKITLPPNGMVGPPTDPPRPAPQPTTVTVNFKIGESAADCAKQVQKALEGKAPYQVTVKGHVVTVTPNLFMALDKK